MSCWMWWALVMADPELSEKNKTLVCEVLVSWCLGVLVFGSVNVKAKRVTVFIISLVVS